MPQVKPSRVDYAVRNLRIKVCDNAVKILDVWFKRPAGQAYIKRVCRPSVVPMTLYTADSPEYFGRVAVTRNCLLLYVDPKDPTRLDLTDLYIGLFKLFALRDTGYGAMTLLTRMTVPLGRTSDEVMSTALTLSPLEVDLVIDILTNTAGLRDLLPNDQIIYDVLGQSTTVLPGLLQARDRVLARAAMLTFADPNIALVDHV